MTIKDYVIYKKNTVQILDIYGEFCLVVDNSGQHHFPAVNELTPKVEFMEMIRELIHDSRPEVFAEYAFYYTHGNGD